MKYKLKNKKGRYYVTGQGFTASSKCAGTSLTQAEIDGLADDGFCGTKEEVTSVKSFAVNYIRASNLVDGEVEGDTRNPSRRRFATRDEAICHGSNFAKRRSKERGAKPGSAGHIGFYVSETSDPVNAKINWKTRLTNPA